MVSAFGIEINNVRIHMHHANHFIYQKIGGVEKKKLCLPLNIMRFILDSNDEKTYINHGAIDMYHKITKTGITEMQNAMPENNNTNNNNRNLPSERAEQKKTTQKHLKTI